MTIEEAFMKNESERYLYELREKGQRDYDSAMITAEQRGELKGNQKTARSMLTDGMSPDLISKYTGLTIEEIEAQR